MYPTLLTYGEFKLYSYPLFVGIAWGVAYHVAALLNLKKEYLIKNFNYFALGLFIMSWLGAKIFFLITSVSSVYEEYIASSNFWMGGGFVFYGGLVFGLLYVFLYKKTLDKDLSYNKLISLLPALAFGHGIGRIGCLLAGCCYGKTTDFLLSIHLHGASRHPVQLYESISLILLGCIFTWWVLRRANALIIAASYLISYSVLRFFLEYLRGDEVRGRVMDVFSSSQVVSLVIFLASTTTLLYVVFNNGNKDENIHQGR